MSDSKNTRQKKHKRALKTPLVDRIARIYQHYPALTTLAIAAVLAGLIFFLTRHHNDAVVKTEEITDVHVDDSLALNILCTPTLECLPFYYAVESGLCDSLRLSLGIFTQTSQFDVDSIIRRTKTIDGAVLDTYRLAYYNKSKCPLPVTEAFKLYGSWQLVSCGQLRFKGPENLKRRVVANARFSTSSFLLEKILNSKKLTFSDIYAAQINDFGICANMLDENQIDAALLPEPFATLAISRGHRSLWSDRLTSTCGLYFTKRAMKDQRKQDQIELLRKVYNEAILDLNSQGAHAADSTLIKQYLLPKEVIDTLRLPEYRPV